MLHLNYSIKASIHIDARQLAIMELPPRTDCDAVCFGEAYGWLT